MRDYFETSVKLPIKSNRSPPSHRFCTPGYKKKLMTVKKKTFQVNFFYDKMKINFLVRFFMKNPKLRSEFVYLFQFSSYGRTLEVSDESFYEEK